MRTETAIPREAWLAFLEIVLADYPMQDQLRTPGPVRARGAVPDGTGFDAERAGSAPSPALFALRRMGEFVGPIYTDATHKDLDVDL